MTRGGDYLYTLKKGMLHAPEFFPSSTAEKNTVDARKNGPMPTGDFSLPEAGKKPAEGSERTGFF